MLPEPFATLLAGAVDYAGLFPPAGLPMAGALANYAGYRAAPDRWALGRFVVPAARLAELLAEADRERVALAGWGLSATLGPDLPADLVAIERTRPALLERAAAVDSVEARVQSPADVARLAAVPPAIALRYGEVALERPFEPILDAMVAAGVRAKVRMGGVTPDAFPGPGAVARFLVAVAERGLRFKATAGLHHPVRGRYRLSYAPDSDTASMYGYLDLMIGVALALDGAPAAAIVAALEGRASKPLDPIAARRVRDRFDGFGSCSFREPLDELAPVVAS